MSAKISNKEKTEFQALLSAEFKPALWLIIVINVLVFVFLLKKGVNPTSPSATDLVHWGANYGPRVTRGELWRLFTSLFVHAGSMHLVSNMITLAVVGRYCFALFGQNASLLIYFVGGLAGASLGTFTHPDTLSVGASGAIFSLFGALLSYCFKNFKNSEIVKNLGLNLALAVLQNLAVGLISKEIDNSAHLGGLITGITFGALYCFKIVEFNTLVRTAIGTSVALLAVTLFAPKHFDRLRALAKVEKPVMQINSIFLHQNNQFKMKNLTSQEYTTGLEKKCLEPIRTLITELELSEDPKEPAIVELHHELQAFADKILELATLTEAKSLAAATSVAMSATASAATSPTPPENGLPAKSDRDPASQSLQTSEESLLRTLSNLEYIEALYSKNPNWPQTYDARQTASEQITTVREAEKNVSLMIAANKTKNVDQQYAASALWYVQTIQNLATSETLRNLSRDEFALLLKTHLGDPLDEQINLLVQFCKKTKEHLHEVTTCTPEHISYLEFSIEIKKEFALLLMTLYREDPNRTGSPKAEALVSALHIPAFNATETKLFTHRPPALQSTLERRKKIEALLDGLRRALANYKAGVNQHSRDHIKSAHLTIQQIQTYLMNPEQF